MGISVSFRKSSRAAASVSPPNNDAVKSFAYVVSQSGELRQYSLPVVVSEVLESQSDVFLCDSDSLAFDDYIPKLDSDAHLQPAQIYFVLPISKLSYRLNGSDMAALAVKATVALQSNNKNTKRGKSKARISPVVVSAEMYDNSAAPRARPQHRFLTDRTSGLETSGSGYSRKLQRYSSKRAKLVVRSFKLRLNTIYEGSVLVFS